MSRVLVVSEDVVGKRMAGPAIRCTEIAKALSSDHQITLAVPKAGTSDLPQIPEVKLVTYDQENLPDFVNGCDLVIVFGYLVSKFPFLKETNKPVVVDIYDPFVLENLEIHKGENLSQRIDTHFFDLGVLNELLRVGDFFVCASEKQRHFWLGMLTAVGRVNPSTYDQDVVLRKLIDVVPFGIPANSPTHSKQVLKGVYPGIGENDKLIIWGGGIYNWFDPLTLVHVMKRLTQKRQDIKLFFMGVRHPNPDIPEMKMCTKAINLSRRLGLEDKYVFFNQWVPYEDRENYLLEADTGISTHLEHLETEFSFRTRILDYIWAGLPIITTQGDSIAELVQENGLGLVVDYEDTDQLADALEKILDDENLRGQCSENLRRIAHSFTWENAIRPLGNFCQEPQVALDKTGPSRKYIALRGSESVKKRPLGYARKFFYYLGEEGLRGAATRVKRFTRRRRAQQ